MKSNKKGQALPDKFINTCGQEENNAKKIGEFDELISIIERARESAFRAVNKELIDMYWEIGRHVSLKVKSNSWGSSVVKEFSQYIQNRFVGLRGFSSQNIWRMKQFYETYCVNEKLSPLVRELSWTHNLLILVSAKTDAAREFYLTAAISNRYSKRELERQLDSMLFERTMISNQSNKLAISKSRSLTALRDNYTLEFLALPENHKELQRVLAELDKAIDEKNSEFIRERNIRNKLAIQKEKDVLADKRDIAWREYDEKREELKTEKNRLITQLYEMADGQIDVVDEFLIKWRIK